MSAGWGFRWFKVNSFIHIYVATTIHNGLPWSETLAYVQQVGLFPDYKYRALRSVANSSEPLPIPNGQDLHQIMKKTEEFILQERLSNIIQGVNTPGSLIEEGLPSTD
jgi:hypothetical protein